MSAYQDGSHGNSSRTRVRRSIAARRPRRSFASRTVLFVGALGLACVVWTMTASAQLKGPLSVPPPGMAASGQIPILRDVGIDQKLNGPLPLDTPFTDE